MKKEKIKKTKTKWNNLLTIGGAFRFNNMMDNGYAATLQIMQVSEVTVYSA